MNLNAIDISKARRLSLKDGPIEKTKIISEGIEDSFLFVAFDNWIKDHPEGGVFRYKGKAFKITPK